MRFGGLHLAVSLFRYARWEYFTGKRVSGILHVQNPSAEVSDTVREIRVFISAELQVR